MAEEQANAVFTVLIEHAGTSPDGRDEFVFHLARGCKEFRFQGGLGFGGKLYAEPRRWRVGCYPEDLTEARAETIQVANETLGALRVALTAGT